MIYSQTFLKFIWLNLHLKLLNACLDENDPPKPTLGFSQKEKINVLKDFALFLCLSFSNDTNFNTRLYLLLKYPDLFYKLAVIIAGNTHFCCCGHGIDFEKD